MRAGHEKNVTSRLVAFFIPYPFFMAVLYLTQETFDSEVLQARKLVLVDFWAPWCGPCQMMSPVVDALGEEMSEVVIGKINVDEEPELAQQFNVLSIPTFMIFKGGQVVDQFSGAMSKEALKQRLEKHF